MVLNSPIQSIDYNGATSIVTVEGGQTYEADKVIVTVPLGVLQAKTIEFNPPLADSKTEAIDRLGMGNMDKLWLLFPSAFWTDELETDWINYVSDKTGEWVQCLNVYKYLKVPVLLLFNVGDAAISFSTLPDD